VTKDAQGPALGITARQGRRTRRRRTGLAAVAAAVACGVALAACSSSNSSSTTGSGTSSNNGGWATSPVRLVYAGLAPTHIDPRQATDLDSFTVTRNLYDPLVWSTAQGTIIPWLATSWHTSADGRSTTFTLRQGVKFTDGSTFTSADVKSTIAAMLATKAGQAGSLLSSVTGVSTPNPQTAVITTSAPDPYLLTHLTRIGIVSAAGVQAHKTGSDPWAFTWFDNNSDGTGPYVLGTYTKGSNLTLMKNKQWWKGWQAGSVDEVVDQFVPDTATRVEMVQRGTAALTETWSVTDAERVGKQSGFTLNTYSTYDIDPLLNLNTQKPPFNNKLVRQAAQYAFNYQAMLSYWNGQATVPGGPMPNDYPGAAQFPAYAQNLAKAKQLIAQSGVNLAANPVTITVIAGVAEFSVLGTIAQQSLTAAGFKVSLQTLPGAQALAVLGKPQQAGNATTLISSPFTTDPTLFLGNFYLPTGSFNFSFYNNPQVDTLIQNARTSTSSTTATADIQQAEQIIRSDAPVIWAAVPKTLVPVPNWLVGYQPSFTDFRWTTYFWPLREKVH
jgi:peptide/nickel transport system substrate-binding protein